MKRNRILAYLLGIIALITASFVFYTLRFKGFPDGYLTELDRAERRLFSVYILVNIIAGLYCLYLGRIASEKRVGKRLLVVTLLYVILTAVIFVVDDYYILNLDNGIGG